MPKTKKSSLLSTVASHPGPKQLSPLNSRRRFESMISEHSLDEYADAFKTREWRTAGEFAFSCGVNPGQTTNKMFSTHVLKHVFAGVAKPGGHPHALRVRMLYNKCKLMLEQDSRISHDSATGELVASLDRDERIRRRKDLMSSLSPTETLEIELQWAHCIEDDFFVMFQKNELEYYSIRSCPTRGQGRSTPKQ